MLTYVYCGLEVSGNALKFSTELKNARANLEAKKIAFIHNKTQSGEPLDAILELFNAA